MIIRADITPVQDFPGVFISVLEGAIIDIDNVIRIADGGNDIAAGRRDADAVIFRLDVDVLLFAMPVSHACGSFLFFCFHFLNN